MQKFLDGRITLHGGDNRDVLKTIADNSIDSIVTDPPYALVSIVKRFGGQNAAPAKGNEAYMRASAGFMGKTWDTGEVAFSEVFWRECLRVLKPGGHLISFSGTRTYHRMTCAIEDAGFEIRDMMQWLYGTGFPKSHDVSKGIDKAAGAVRPIVGSRKADDIRGGNLMHRTTGENDNVHTIDITAPATTDAAAWQGWGTALKPANEPICLARKPLSEKTVAANVLKWGTGAINIDGCRVNTGPVQKHTRTETITAADSMSGVSTGSTGSGEFVSGRFPANVVHDGSDEVIEAFPYTKSGTFSGKRNKPKTKGVYGKFKLNDEVGHIGDEGSAARFFYNAKANEKDRAGSKHPTVKPISLMEYFCRLVTPPGGTVLDPFAGSGSTGEAAYNEGFKAVLIEREEEYLADIAARFEQLKPVNDNAEPQQELFAA